MAFEAMRAIARIGEECRMEKSYLMRGRGNVLIRCACTGVLSALSSGARHDPYYGAENGSAKKRNEGKRIGREGWRDSQSLESEEFERVSWGEKLMPSVPKELGTRGVSIFYPCHVEFGNMQWLGAIHPGPNDIDIIWNLG